MTMKRCAAEGCPTGVARRHALCLPHFRALDRDLQYRLVTADDVARPAVVIEAVEFIQAKENASVR